MWGSGCQFFSITRTFQGEKRDFTVESLSNATLIKPNSNHSAPQEEVKEYNEW